MGGRWRHRWSGVGGERAEEAEAWMPRGVEAAVRGRGGGGGDGRAGEVVVRARGGGGGDGRAGEAQAVVRGRGGRGSVVRLN
ncbi:hypothetical protein GUJ93_ZPchr0008g14163 [Zizania palustris]|uniref:Uncharacterized protein n=1 Tax=Zizania palustris TaxID=103762 RepID=A0A8J5VHU1_ZIZPA|nr:hypothetical protein GUJ93_ZPchr0008g14163 [Zizania palustris]